MRDIIKQLALLEDHMFQPTKRCKDCIRKHFLTIEGLAEECATLCNPKAILPETRDIASRVRVLHHAWEARPNDPGMNEHVASKLRKMRKNLMKRYAALPVTKLPTKETRAVASIVGALAGRNTNLKRRGNARRRTALNTTPKRRRTARRAANVKRRNNTRRNTRRG